MKILEYSPLDRINLFLSHLNIGESTIKGNLEVFSCKHTVNDRKLSISIEHEILDYLGQSVESDPPSPVEYLSSKTSRKTLIYLVLTLGHMYPDYDFSAVRTHLFFKEEEWDNLTQIFETYLFEAAKKILDCFAWVCIGKNICIELDITETCKLQEWAAANGGSSLLEIMSEALDEVINHRECEIYGYNPDFEGDPVLQKGAIWSLNFFFYNRKLKRIVSFRCCCLSNLVADGFIGNCIYAEDGDEDLLLDMEM